MYPTKKKRLLRLLANAYPEPKSELTFRNRYQLLVCVMLSAQSTDKKVNELSPELFRRYPDFQSLSKATPAALEPIIREINYHKTKARHLVQAAALIVEKHRGRLPATREELLELPGVGNKTASVVLSETGSEPAFPVDTHIFRVSRRLGLASGSTPDAVAEELMGAFRKETWRDLHHRLIFHGRRVCKARTPLCGACSLAALCPSRRVD